MMKAGLIEGMMDDAMEDVGGAEEEDVDEEVQKVLLEVAGEDAVSLPAAGKARVSAQEVAQMTEEVRVRVRVHSLPATPVIGRQRFYV